MSAAAWVAVGLLGGRSPRWRASSSTPSSRGHRARPRSRSGSSPSTCSARCALGVVAGAALDGEALDDRRRRRDRLLHHLLDLDARLAPARATRGRADLAWLNIGLSLVAGFARRRPRPLARRRL